MSDHDDLETVHVAASQFEAETLAAVLRDAGIHARVVPGGYEGLASGAKSGVPVQVEIAQAQRARAVLDEVRDAATGIDWEAVDVGDEPARTRGGGGDMPLLFRIALYTTMAVMLLALLSMLVMVVI